MSTGHEGYPVAAWTAWLLAIPGGFGMAAWSGGADHVVAVFIYGYALIVPLLSMVTYGSVVVIDETWVRQIRGSKHYTLYMQLMFWTCLCCTILQFLMYLFGTHLHVPWIMAISYGREELLSVLLVVMYSLSFLSCIAWLHIWSVEKTNEASSQNPPHETEDCSYCGHEAGIVCTSCDSIQWPRLTMSQGIATYVAHHRWRMLAAGLTIGLVGPMGFHYSKYYDQVQQRMLQLHEYETDATQLMRSVLKIRAFIHSQSQRERMRDPTGPPSVPNGLDSIVRTYYDVTWFGSRVLDYLRCTKCNDRWRLNSGLRPRNEADEVIRDACNGIMANAARDIRNAAGKRMRMPPTDGTFLYALDRSFIRYINSFDPQLVQRLGIGSSCRELIAADLYDRLKFLACVISELTYNHNIDRARDKGFLKPERDSARSYMHKVYDCESCLSREKDQLTLGVKSLFGSAAHTVSIECPEAEVDTVEFDQCLHAMPWNSIPYEMP